MEDELMGTIKLFAGNFAPRGYFTCEGQLLSIANYSALYSLLGTTYGGDGISNFKLPDLRGAFPTQCTNIAGGTPPGGTYRHGQTGGLQAAVITAANMPPHTHTILKGPGTNITGNIAVTTTLQASTGDGANSTPSATNNVLGKTVDANGNLAPNLYTNAAPNQNLAGIKSTATNNLNFDPSGLQLTPWGSSAPLPLPTLPPFVAMQYIICYQGIFPSRP